MRKGLAGQRLVAVFIAGLVLLNYPILSLFDRPQTVFGLPLFPAALFALWALLRALRHLGHRWDPTTETVQLTNPIRSLRIPSMRIIHLFDIPICQSQSNTGNQNSRPQAWAKNIISVGASTNTDAAASFSNYGATTVDLFAPGQDIWSSVPGSIYYDSLVGEPVTIFEDDFTDAANWDTTDYVTTPWALYSMWVNSAPYSFGCTNYGDNESSWAYSAAPLDLSAKEFSLLELLAL